jgi:drug/metabolite transporter (DMT)-like permease
MNTVSRENIYKGIGMAVLAAMIWSGNFIVAKGLTQSIHPISLNFYRWLIATLVMLPFAFSKLKTEWRIIRQHKSYLFFVALTGIALFNTLVYVGAHYTTAINLALIGTTSSPIMSVVLAAIFLKEKISLTKLAGLLLCIIGVLYLISKGSWHALLHLHFSEGDCWVLAAAFFFAIYNTLVKKKPRDLSATSFLFVIFCLGTLIVLPFFIWEQSAFGGVNWNGRLILSVLYLGIGASVISFLLWNIAIGILGAGRTSLFGNLIPVFSSLEAFLILGEDFTKYFVFSMLIVFGGILLANIQLKKQIR